MANADKSIDKELDDGLTDEEREALTFEEGGEDDQDTTSQADDQEDDDASDEGTEGDDDGVSAAADDGATDAAGRDDGAAADDQGDEPSGTPVQAAPVFVALAPADADAKLAEIGTKKEALITAFDDGDITAKEFQQQTDALGKEERAIEREIDKASISASMEQQRQQNEWAATVSGFLDQNTSYKDNPRLHRALDMEVRDFAVTDEAKGMTGAQILAKAHANLVEAGMVKASAAAPGIKVKAKAPAPVLPPNIGKLPAADMNDTSGGKYANLDRLAERNPLAYEEALDKMSESERNAYLATA